MVSVDGLTVEFSGSTLFKDISFVINDKDMLIVIAMDAIQSIPFAFLRYQKRPVRFAALKMLFIVTSIVLNIVYFVILKGRDVGMF